MIDPGELMIGNYVDFEGIILKSGEAMYRHSKLFNPIPLTPEWLLKFGFVENDSKQFRFENRLIVTRAEGLCDYVTGIHLKTVHQLQNFFYQNTGKKLILHK